MKVSTIIAQPVTDHKAQTLNATIHNIFAAKARHDQLVQEAMERTAKESPWAVGEILWI